MYYEITLGMAGVSGEGLERGFGMASLRYMNELLAD